MSYFLIFFNYYNQSLNINLHAEKNYKKILFSQRFWGVLKKELVH